jgi:ethanolamine transporter EutH
MPRKKLSKAQVKRKMKTCLIFIVAAAVGLFFVAKQIKIPGFDVIGSFAQYFPQLSAALGIERELTAEQADKIRSLFTEGAGPDAPALMQLFFPTPEEKAERNKVDLGI